MLTFLQEGGTDLSLSQRFDKLSGEDARRYFKKFCKRWNRGELSRTSCPVPSVSISPR